MELAVLKECTFPDLKSLRVTLRCGATSSVDKAWVNFLERHPTIEELSSTLR